MQLGRESDPKSLLCPVQRWELRLLMALALPWGPQNPTGGAWLSPALLHAPAGTQLRVPVPRGAFGSAPHPGSSRLAAPRAHQQPWGSPTLAPSSPCPVPESSWGSMCSGTHLGAGDRLDYDQGPHGDRQRLEGGTDWAPDPHLYRILPISRARGNRLLPVLV